MSKTNDTSRELRADELENVSGGLTANFDMWNFSSPRDASSGQWSLGASNPYKAAQAEGYGN
jgi:hypothetical protein